MGLAWRLARRELRGGLVGFRVFLASLALGVAAIAAVGTLSAAVLGGLRADARALLGGDVEIQLSQRSPDPAEAAWLCEHAVAVSETIEMRAMARAGDARALVELKAVDAAYPLVGGSSSSRGRRSRRRWPSATAAGARSLRPVCWQSSGSASASGSGSARPTSRSAP
jgi:putative ABC transport system permease protein